jgi:signal transduction histidine kinase
VEISVARVARSQGDLFVSVIRDITDRKRAEEELRQSHAFNQALIDHSPLGISVRNHTGKLLFANPAWRTIWAISDPDFHDDTTRERDALQFNARDDYLKPYQADLRRVYEQGGYLHLPELKTTRPRPGAAEWVSQHFYAITNEQGQVDRMVILTEDVSDRKRRERELEAIAAIAMALRAAATRDDMIPVIVHQVYSLLKADGAALIRREPATGEAVIVYGQGVGADSIGLRIPPGAGIVGHVIATGRPYLTQDAGHDPHVFRPDLANELHALACAPLIARDQIIGVLWAGRATTITEEEARLLAAIADMAANALQRAEVLETLEQRVYDRTRELAEANERLTELDRLKSKFVSDVSHELRTPITSLMLNVELLEHGKPEKREHYLSVIRQQTARQVQLIEDILNLSRLELSTARAQFAPVKVNALVEQAVNVYRSSAEAANLHLNFTPDADQPVVLGVESHLSQVVTNLIANAINYTPAGSVEVATRLGV